MPETAKDTSTGRAAWSRHHPARFQFLNFEANHRRNPLRIARDLV